MTSKISPSEIRQYFKWIIKKRWFEFFLTSYLRKKKEFEKFL